MCKSIIKLIDIILLCAKPDVALLKKPDSHRIPTRNQHPLANIKLSFLYYQRILNIFLSNKLIFLGFNMVQDLN